MERGETDRRQGKGEKGEQRKKEEGEGRGERHRTRLQQPVLNIAGVNGQFCSWRRSPRSGGEALQRSAAHCSTLQHTTAHCRTLNGQFWRRSPCGGGENDEEEEDQKASMTGKRLRIYWDLEGRWFEGIIRAVGAANTAKHSHTLQHPVAQCGQQVVHYVDGDVRLENLLGHTLTFS